MEFAIGDWVKPKKYFPVEGIGPEDIGQIIKKKTEYLFYVKFSRTVTLDTGLGEDTFLTENRDVALCHGENIIHAEGGEYPMTEKNKLTDLQKEALDADIQVLVEEGLLTAGLTVSTTGSQYFMEFLTRKFKGEVAKELKAKRLAVEKEEKK